MPIPDDRMAQAREMLSHATRPLFFHDDDCDGVTSFIMCYQYCKEGTGVCVKQSPILQESYLRKVEELHPDLIVVLDKPDIAPEFLDGVRQPVLWIDHHQPRTDLVQRYPNVTYLNPRIWDDADNRPTSYWSYRITHANLWLATVGSVADWHMPDYLKEFDAKYPGFLPEKYAKVEDLYLGSRLGQLIKVLQFNLKGATADVKKSILTLTRVEHPEEILSQTTPRGKFLWKKYQALAAGYERHLAAAIDAAEGAGKLLVYAYADNDQTYTTELSNELLIRYPTKVTIVCRMHDDKRKCSVRSKGVELPTRIKAALEGLDGRGGGHANACGVVVAEKDWETFRARLEHAIGK